MPAELPGGTLNQIQIWIVEGTRLIGKHVAHYSIIEKLGEGGMGLVYKARDAHLDRFVAIKVLPVEKVSDAERKARFIQEAKAASALNHPNIVHIYDITRDQGVDFIAMEYIAGKTLDQLIPRKGMRLNEALRIAVQVADALAAAHAAGIIHRDLKPGNVMVNEQGHVKILDFGLAKLTERSDTAEEATRTLDVQTEPGVVMGTAAYMSPEQAEGHAVDARSDIFSFGALLYEMVTGRRAFAGHSRMSTLASLLRDEVKPVRDLAEDVSPELERIISRCLRKDPARRFQHMDDVKVALQEIREESESGKLRTEKPAASRSRRAWLLPAAVTACALSLCAIAAYLWLGRAPSPPAPQVPIQLTRDRGLTGFPSLSADGRLLAFASDRDGGDNLDIYVRQVAGGQPIRLTSDKADDYDAAISPDGTQVAFRSDRAQGGVYVVPALGGEERLIAPGGRRPRYSSDGQSILYWVGHPGITGRGSGRIYVIPAAGGVPRQIAAGYASAGYPVWAPSGTQVLFFGREKATDGPYNWAVISVQNGAVKETGRVSGFPDLWTPDGVIFSASEGSVINLWQYALPETTLKRAAEPNQLTFGVGRQAQPSISSAGDMAFTNATVATDLWMLPFDAESGKVTGEPRALTHDDAAKPSFRLSLDGRTLVYESNRSGSPAVWVRDFETGKESLLVPGTTPRLSGDGNRVAYTVREGGQPADYLLDRRNKVPQKLRVPGSWAISTDGARTFTGGGGARALETMNVASGQTTLLVPAGAYSIVYQPSFSPDDRWIAFVAKTAPDLSQIFIVPFQEGVTPERSAWIPITDGQSWESGPQWSRGGNVLYFPSERDGFRCLWAQRLDPVSRRPSGPPFNVRHFHDAQRPSMMGFSMMNEATINFAVGADKLVCNFTQVSGNIWMVKRGSK